MSNQYRLVDLENSELLAGLSELVRRSNELTGGVLAHLAELENRMLHLELGFPSVFAYCVQVLGMSEGAAGRRLTAAPVCRGFPEAFALVARGDLHLSALCALGPHLKPENAHDLLEACRAKSRRRVEELLAARFPMPDVKEQIRRLPVRSGMQSAVRDAQSANESHSSEPLEKRVDAGTQQGDGELRPGTKNAERAATPDESKPNPAGLLALPASGAAAPRRRELEALSVDRFGVHFTADAELRELIERARALASHRLPNGDLASLMKVALRVFVQQEEKRRFALGSKQSKVRVESKLERTQVQTEAAGASAGTRDPSSSAPRSAPVFGGDAGALVVDPGVSAGVARGTDPRSTPPGGALPSTKKPKGTTSFVRPGKRGRHVPAEVRRQVYVRDQGRCSFVSDDGRRCEATTFLEFDHVEPWAALGATTVDNLRLCCRAHNGLHARNWFGSKHVADKIAIRRREAPRRP